MGLDCGLDQNAGITFSEAGTGNVGIGIPLGPTVPQDEHIVACNQCGSGLKPERATGE